MTSVTFLFKNGRKLKKCLTLFFFVYIKGKKNNKSYSERIRERVEYMASAKVNKINGPQINAYIIIGDANMGKSSVIRHLYGAFRGMQNSGTVNWLNRNIQTILRKMIALVNGQNIEVCMHGTCALQEINIDRRSYEFGVSHLSPSVANVILALRLVDAKGRKNWNADDYIRFFQQRGWNIAKTAVLTSNQQYVQSNYYAAFFPNCLTVYSTKNGNPVCPTNAVAAIVRSHFGWV